MPRYLYLLRHAESAEKMPTQPDKERELTPRGIREAALIGTYLYKEHVTFDVVLTSVAARTKMTANLVADAMKFGPEKIVEQDALYDASTRTFFQFIQQISDKHNTVLCVSHNPSVSYLAESLSKSEIGLMPPGGLAILKFKVASWKEISQGSGELQNYIFPQMLGEE